jgi:uncharacterized membrane protein YbhN (UPF0104 family)
VKPLLKAAASLALLAGCMYLLDWHSLAQAAQRLSPWVFCIAVLLASAQFLPLLVRWQLLIASDTAWYLNSARYLYANLLNFVSPGNLGGDVYRFFAFRRQATNSFALLSILVRERLLGLTSMLIGLVVGAAGMALAGMEAGGNLWRAFGLVSAAGLVLLLVAPHVCARLLKEPWRSHVLATLAPRRAGENAVLLGWSLLALALWVGTTQFIAMRLGLEVPWHVVLAIAAAVELVRIVPVTIQGIGLREGAYAALFGLSGYPSAAGFVVGAAAYLALSAALVVTGALGLAMLARKGNGNTG